MSTSRRILIHNDLDVIFARLQAREVAREIGFNTVDQARISLAASELARVLAQSLQGQGEIVISGANSDGHIGIQVISLSHNPHPPLPQPTPHQPAHTDHTLMGGDETALASALAMVDEYLVESEDKEGDRVTLMKWLT